MMIQKVYKQIPYWIINNEDKPTGVGFRNWCTKYVDNNIDKTLFKFNQIDSETFELCLNKNQIDFESFPTFYFEILINNKRYYIYIDSLIKVLNNINIYRCKIDRWTTYGHTLFKAMTGYRNKFSFVRGHIGLNENDLPDEKLDETYVQIPGRNNNVRLYSAKSNIDFGLINASPNDKLVSPTLYLVFKYDDVSRPFFFLPLLAIVGEKSTAKIRCFYNGEVHEVENHSIGFNAILTDTKNPNPLPKNFIGVFEGPNIHQFRVQKLGWIEFTDTKNIKHKFLNINYNPIGEFFIDGIVPDIDFTPEVSAGSILPVTNPEFWKLNTTNYVKSGQIMNCFDFRIGSQKINYAKLYNQETNTLDLRGKFFFNTNILNVLLNRKMNSDERIFKYTANVPSSSSQYAQYVQSVFNTTNTGLQITQDKYARNQAYGALNNIFKVGAGFLGSGLMGGLSSGLSAITGSVENAMRFSEYKKTLAASFKDKQLSMTTNNVLSSDEEALALFNRYEIQSSGADDTKRFLGSRNKISEGNLIELNNVVVRYGWNYYNTAMWSDLCYIKQQNICKHSYVQIDYDFLKLVMLPYLNNSVQNSVPIEYYNEFITIFSTGTRLWNSADNVYEISTTTFDSGYWNS